MPAPFEVQTLQLAAAANQYGDTAVRHPRAARDVEFRQAPREQRDHIERAVREVAPPQLERGERGAAGDQRVDAAISNVAATEQLDSLERGNRSGEECDARVSHIIATLEGELGEKGRRADAREEGDVSV